VTAFHLPPDASQATLSSVPGVVAGDALGSLARIRAHPVSNAVNIRAHAIAFIVTCLLSVK